MDKFNYFLLRVQEMEVRVKDETCVRQHFGHSTLYHGEHTEGVKKFERKRVE